MPQVCSSLAVLIIKQPKSATSSIRFAHPHLLWVQHLDVCWGNVQFLQVTVRFPLSNRRVCVRISVTTSVGGIAIRNQKPQVVIK